MLQIPHDTGSQSALTLCDTVVFVCVLVWSVANENVSLVISRQILTEFCTYFSSLPDAVGKEVAHFTLDKVQPRVVSFEEQVNMMT